MKANIQIKKNRKGGLSLSPKVRYARGGDEFQSELEYFLGLAECRLINKV